jgi:hypothetical protein
MLDLRRTATAAYPPTATLMGESTTGAPAPIRGSVIALAFALTVLSGGGAIRAVRAQDHPVAEAPVLNVGDTWRWTGGRSRRVVAIEGSLVVTPLSNARCSGCRAYRDKNFTVVKLVDRDGKVVNDPEIGYKMLDFPLKKGKTWESDQLLVNNTTRAPEPYKNTFAVEGYEEVKTKAGTFKAFRITHVQQRAHSSFGSEVGRSWRETLWYSPEAKAFVKREVNSRVTWGPDWELESYSLKSQSAAAPAAPSAAASAAPAPAPAAPQPIPPVSAAAPQAPRDSPPAAWPDLSKAEPGLTQSPVTVIMWSGDIEPPGADVPSSKARWSGKWAGWACRNQACDARLIVEKVTSAGAAIIYGFASESVKPVTARLEATFVGEQLEATFRDGATVAYRMRPEGDIEVYYRKGSHWYAGVLSREKR